MAFGQPVTACKPTTTFLVHLFVRVIVVGAFLLPLGLWAQGQKQSYDLPAGDAPVTLRRFSKRSGWDVLFSAEAVRGVRTNAVRGEFSAREALDRMLTGTTLVAVADERTGGLAVLRNTGATPRGLPPHSRNDAQSTASVSDNVVQLKEFEVSTTIGSYAEVNSSAATKTAANLRDFAGTVQVLNANFIGDTRSQTLEDLYPYVVGMTRESTAAVGFTLRGFSSNTTLTMFGNLQVDGLPGLGSRFGSPTTANVERVEVLKGPMSILYGQMSPGGIINIETKRPSAIPKQTLFTSVSTYASGLTPFGEASGFTATFDSTGPIGEDNHFLYRFITSYEDIDAWRRTGPASAHYFFPSFTYRPDANSEVTFQAEILRQRRFSDGYLVAPFYDTRLVARHDITYQEAISPEYDHGDTFGLSAQHRFTNSWTLKINVRNVQHRDGRVLDDNRDVVSANPIEDSLVARRYRNQFNRRRYAYYDANYYGDVGPPSFRQTMLLGVSLGFETHDFIRWAFTNAGVPDVNLYAPVLGTPNPPIIAGPTADAISKLYNYGVYFSDQIAFGRQWRASVGVRYEKQDAKYTDPVPHIDLAQHLHATVPTFGLIFEPRETLSLYASYARGFKPSVPQTVDAAGNHFSAEIADQIEIGVKSEFLENRVTALLSAYTISRRNVIEGFAGQYLPNGLEIDQLFGEQRSAGLEATITYQPLPHWQLQAGYTYIDARVIQAGDPTVVNARLENVPRNSGHFWTRYNFPDGALRGFGLGFGVSAVGQRNGITTNIPGQKLFIDNYVKVENAFFYDWKRYSLALNISNTLDKSYILSADANTDVVPGAPRKITVSARYTF